MVDTVLDTSTTLYTARLETRPNLTSVYFHLRGWMNGPEGQPSRIIDKSINARLNGYATIANSMLEIVAGRVGEGDPRDVKIKAPTVIGAFTGNGRLHGVLIHINHPDAVYIKYMISSIDRHFPLKGDAPIRGIGTALIQTCATWAKKQNKPALTVQTTKDALPFYKALGFEEETWKVSTASIKSWMSLPESKFEKLLNQTKTPVRITQESHLPRITDPAPLWRAIGEGTLQQVRILSIHKALVTALVKLDYFDPTAVIDSGGSSFLHWSCGNGHLQLTELFLSRVKDHAAGLNRVDDSKNTPLDRAYLADANFAQKHQPTKSTRKIIARLTSKGAKRAADL